MTRLSALRLLMMYKKPAFIPKTAGIIIIGDEILKGHTKDTNASFLLSKLWANGINVGKVSFIPDKEEEISAEVAQFSSLYEFVITAGGVGPTHDDVTLAGVAKAFNESLCVNEEAKEMIKKYSGLRELSPAFNKMVEIPKSANLIFGIDPLTKAQVKFPLFQVKNVFIFPGVPEYLQKSFLINEHFFLSDNKFLLTKLYLSANEEEIAFCIGQVSKDFPNVQVGSYPVLNDIYKVKITLESQHIDELEKAYSMLIKELPKGVVVSVKKCLPNRRDEHHEVFNSSEKKVKRRLSTSSLNSLSLVDLDHYLDTQNCDNLSIAIKCTWAVFQQTVHMYSLDQICIGFNGGKDCTAVMHLYIAFMKKMFPDSSQKLLGLYLKQSNPFEEAQEFIRDCEVNYSLDMIVIEGSIKEGLSELKLLYPQIKAVVMGTRRHDPYSLKLRSFSMTDKGWPSYLRVFPILDWSYCEVWQFLRTFQLPYCRLYDEGYTSLGSIENTSKNAALLLHDGRYSPAYCLSDEFKERNGRD